MSDHIEASEMATVTSESLVVHQSGDELNETSAVNQIDWGEQLFNQRAQGPIQIVPLPTSDIAAYLERLPERANGRRR